MATTVPVDIGTLISRKPGVRGGRPCIAGIGVSVLRIANYHNMGYTAEEIANNYGHISLAQVHAALTYYYSNQQEIEDENAEDEAAYEMYIREHTQQHDVEHK